MRKPGSLRWRLALTGSLLAAPAAAAQAPAASDAKAVALAGRVLEALGGRQAWQAVRFVRFDFAVEREGKTVATRRHFWDKHTGRYRVEGTTREGQPFVVLMDLNTREGSAYLTGKTATGEQAQELLKRGYGAWVNDSYWLLMPYKMTDPGVVLAYAGEAHEPGGTWDKVALSFEDVGLTPKDKYWAFVNRHTGLVDRWEYVLQGGPGPPTAWTWKGWTKHGDVLLAPERVNVQDGTRIHFPVLELPAAIPDAVFTSPDPAS